MYTESDSEIVLCQGGAQVLSQALAASKQINLNKLIDADGVKNCGFPTLAKPIFESRAVYIIIMLLIFLGETGSHIYGESWSAPQNIPTSTCQNSSLQIAMNGDSGSKVIALWKARNEWFDQIYTSQTSDEGAHWTTPQILSPDQQNVFDPQISISSDGTKAVAVWSGTENNRTKKIFASYTNDEGSTWSIPVSLSEESTTQTSSPQVSMSLDGTKAMVVWSGFDGQSNRIYMSITNDSGLHWSTPTCLICSTFHCNYPQIAMSSDGSHAVMIWHGYVWNFPNVNAWLVFVSSSNDGGASWSTPQILSTSSLLNTFANLDMSADGLTIMTTWQGSENLRQNIFTSVSIDGGTNWSNPITIANDVYVNTKPQIAMSSDGSKAMVVWNMENQVNHAMTIDRGIHWSSPTQLSSALLNQDPQIKINENGSSGVVLWNSETDVKARYTTNGGANWSTETLVSHPMTNNSFSQLRVNSNGARAVIGWIENSENTEAIYTSFFNE